MDPFTFRRNRVSRIYKGGLLIDNLQGAAEPKDDFIPEEWMASTVKACNDGGTNPMEGVSVAIVDGKEAYFTDLIAKDPEALFGKAHLKKYGPTPGFLTKLLDSAIRLPLQAHPDRVMSQKLYNSPFGKTEAWIVLDGRHDGKQEPYVLLGFNESLDEEVFRKEALDGDMKDSLGMMHKHYVKPGDVMMLLGGVPHAIGPGNFILEIMEPTDWVVQPESLCGDRRLTLADRFGKVAPKASLDVFHFKGASKEQTWNDAALSPKTIEKTGSFTLSSLIDREEQKYFGALKISLSGEWSWKKSVAPFATGVLVKGSCYLESKGSILKLKQGDALFIPASAKTVTFKGEAEIIFALPPV
jgi:mannose-6-phosphate isomerase